MITILVSSIGCVYIDVLESMWRAVQQRLFRVKDEPSAGNQSRELKKGDNDGWRSRQRNPIQSRLIFYTFDVDADVIGK